MKAAFTDKEVQQQMIAAHQAVSAALDGIAIPPGAAVVALLTLATAISKAMGKTHDDLIRLLESMRHEKEVERGENLAVAIHPAGS